MGEGVAAVGRRGLTGRGTGVGAPKGQKKAKCEHESIKVKERKTREATRGNRKRSKIIRRQKNEEEGKREEEKKEIKNRKKKDSNRSLTRK